MSVSYVGSASTSSNGTPGTAVSLTIPSGVQNGDMLIAYLAIADPTTSTNASMNIVSGLSDWTSGLNNNLASGSRQRLRSLSTVYNSATTTTTATLGGSSIWIAVVVAYRDSGNSPGIANISGQNSAVSGTSIATLTKSPVTAGTDMLSCAFLCSDSAGHTWTEDIGAERVDTTSGTGTRVLSLVVVDDAAFPANTVITGTHSGAATTGRTSSSLVITGAVATDAPANLATATATAYGASVSLGASAGFGVTDAFGWSVAFPLTASLGVTAPEATAAVAGSLSVSGGLAQTAPEAQAAGAGTLSVEGNCVVVAPEVTAALDSTATVGGSVDATAPGATANISGAYVSAQLAASAPEVVYSALGQVIVSAELAVDAPEATAAADGFVGIPAILNAVSPNPDSGTGLVLHARVIVRDDFTTSAPEAQAAISGIVLIPAEGALDAVAPGATAVFDGLNDSSNGGPLRAVAPEAQAYMRNSPPSRRIPIAAEDRTVKITGESRTVVE